MKCHSNESTFIITSIAAALLSSDLFVSAKDNQTWGHILSNTFIAIFIVSALTFDLFNEWNPL